MKKTLLFVIAVLLLSCIFIACETTKPSGEDGGEVKTNIKPLDEANALNISKYCIIYSDNASDRYKASKDNLYSAVKETCDIIISSSSDYIGRGEETLADAAEIVVGKTNRKDFDSLRYWDFTIRREGSRIYICGGSAASTEKAVDFFIKNYLSASGVLIPDNGYYDLTSAYNAEEITINGIDIREYSILSEDESNAYGIQDIIGTRVGCELNVTSNKSSESKYIILDVSDTMSCEYEMRLEEKNLLLLGNNKTILYAIDYFEERLYSNKTDTKTSINSEDCKKIYTDQARENLSVESTLVPARADATKLKYMQEMIDNSVISRGNRTRVANVIRKAMDGEPVTIGFIGGSITEGVGASKPENCYAVRFKTLWENEFPNSELTFINAGMGATDSVMGVHRADDDLLKNDPDLVIVDFAVNDNEGELYREAYESLIRKILRKENSPGVILIFFFNALGDSRQKAYTEIGNNYDLPIISYKNAVWPNNQKLYAWEELSNDYVHPNDVGHAIISELLINYVQNVKENVDLISFEVDTELPKSITRASFEYSVLLTRDNITPTEYGSFKDNTDNNYQFKNGWICIGGTDAIVFELENVNSIYLLYFLDETGNSGKVDVRLDGLLFAEIDADGSNSWGSHTWFAEILPNQGQNNNYSLSIEINSNNKNKSFILYGIMVSYYYDTNMG